MHELTLACAAPAALSPDEEALLVKAAQEDLTAFAPLYRQYVAPIYRYLFSRAGNAHDAEDLTAQVFLEALEGLNRYRHSGPFAAWLFTIARRRAVDYLRRQKPVTSEDFEPVDTAPDPLTLAIHHETLQSLRQQIAGLDEAEQELLRLRFAAGLSFAAIAVVLKRSEAAVKMSLHRLLGRLERQWKNP